MSRKFSERHVARSPWSTIAGFVSIATLAACSAGADTTAATDTTTEQALTEAQSSYADAHVAAEACFATFDSCRSAAGADLVACKTALAACLPEQAGPGPHCGPPRKGPGPGGAGCEGGPPKDGEPGGDPGPPPPPKDGEMNGPPPGGGPGGDSGGKEPPGFCKKVPLPPPPELRACKDTLDTCVVAGADNKACFDAHHACVKAAFDAAFQKLCANKDAICADTSAPADACARVTKQCAAGVAPAATN